MCNLKAFFLQIRKHHNFNSFIKNGDGEVLNHYHKAHIHQEFSYRARNWQYYLCHSSSPYFRMPVNNTVNLNYRSSIETTGVKLNIKVNKLNQTKKSNEEYIIFFLKRFSQNYCRPLLKRLLDLTFCNIGLVLITLEWLKGALEF